MYSTTEGMVSVLLGRPRVGGSRGWDEDTSPSADTRTLDTSSTRAGHTHVVDTVIDPHVSVSRVLPDVSGTGVCGVPSTPGSHHPRCLGRNLPWATPQRHPDS